MKIIMDEPNNYITELDLSKTIFWIGCGMSKDSGLPLGGEMLDKIMNIALPPHAWEAMQQIWQYAQNEINDLLKISLPLIRLELALGCIDEVDTEFKESNRRLLNGITRFLKITPCYSHRLLHDIAKKHGTVIITPNFDLGIENAYSTNINRVEMCNGVPAYNCNGMNIYHYHGTPYDIDNLGITIKQIKKGLPLSFREYITDLLSKGYNLICMGFSCSDFFDVTPFFESLPDENYDGTGVFIQYGSGQIPDYNIEIADGIQTMFKCFKTSYYCVGRPNQILSSLLNEQEKEDNTISFDWMQEFTDEMNKIPQIRKKFYLLKILEQIGININQILPHCEETMEKYLSSLLDEYLSKESFIDNMVRAFPNDSSKCLITFVSELCIKYGIRTKEAKEIKERINREYYYKAGRDDEVAASEKITFEDLWNIFCERDISKLTQSRNIYASVRLSKQYLGINNSVDNMAILSKLLEVNNTMLQLHYIDFMYIGYYLSLKKVNWQLNYRLYGKSPSIQELKENIRIALEISSLGEVQKLIRWWTYLQNKDVPEMRSLCDKLLASCKIISQHSNGELIW